MARASRAKHSVQLEKLPRSSETYGKDVDLTVSHKEGLFNCLYHSVFLYIYSHTGYLFIFRLYKNICMSLINIMLADFHHLLLI